MSRKKKKQVKAPEFVQRLSKAPDENWPQRIFYHGSRIALLVLLSAGITFLFPPESERQVPLPREGDVAAEDVAAQLGFDVPRDPGELARLQAEAEASVPPVFQYQAETQDSVEASLSGFFDQVQQASEAGGRTAVEEVLAVEDLEDRVEYFLNPAELGALRRATLDVVRELSGQVLDSDYEEDVLDAGRIEVRYPDGSQAIRPAEEFLWGTAFYTAAVETLGPSTSEFQGTVNLLLIHFFDSSYGLDVSRTDAKKSEARLAVPEVEGNVVAGEYIVRRGDRIGPSQLRRLTAHRAQLESQGLIRELGRDWGSMFGKFLLNLLLLSVFGVLLFFYRGEVYGSFRWLFLLFLLLSVYFLVAAGISWQEYPWEFLPIAFVVLPVAILWDGRMALILGLVLGVLSGAQGPFNEYPILAFTVLGGAAAALSARAVRRRSQVWIIISLITLGYALSLTAFGFSGDAEPGSVFLSVSFAALNATVSALLAMGFMPVYEWFTGITTDQTLLEWADPNRSLLKSLSLEASGTYAHTINVANLAEAAATAIGANGLLVRVGIYYHDVGKMLKPQYFVENQPGSRNPHDKLKPHTSATIVREHVIEGERMAREEGVPEVVVRFIPEHHGTQLIGFFYEKAKEEAGEEPDPSEFRYPGPKPQSKETAIAMLADSVESATRVLQEPSKERVEELVQTIVRGKFRDGQLSEAPLTLREIALIQEQFVKVVSGMFHHRLDYPATRHITEAQNGEPQAPEEEASGEDGSGDDQAEQSASAGEDAAGQPEEASGEKDDGEGAQGPTTGEGKFAEEVDGKPLEEQLPLTPASDGDQERD